MTPQLREALDSVYSTYRVSEADRKILEASIEIETISAERNQLNKDYEAEMKRLERIGVALEKI